MLDGKQVVFLSCMDSYADRLARPIRDRLNELGYRAVILTDEPMLRGAFDPEANVDGYLEASDAFVALATHDNRMGPTGTAGNILDEIGRARRIAGLKDVMLVMKQDTVKLPSNINPLYERLDPEDPDAAVEVIMRQLDAWGVVPTRAPTPAPREPLPDGALDTLLAGVDLGEHDATEARLRRLFGTITKQDQRRVSRDIFNHLLAVPGDGREIHIVSGFLEACARIDAALVEPDWIEQLVESRVVQHRMCAAVILWQRASVDPGSVPLDLVAKLAKPSTEDWYVYSPAIAAAKQLALTRRSAMEILLDLTRSRDATDRSSGVHALGGIAHRVDPVVVWITAREQLEQLATDHDETVAGPAGELLRDLFKQYGHLEPPEVPDPYGHFGL
ncbi:hypothetical protein [Mycobacterium sp.]|uniref:hypothetical protein n=1 Tax=Mycobacterium sp. TaxID=1785 RepID=UPI002D49E90F|nr:hypothetical protein [Mycobacterium sp.]HZA09991.1 hypothetical protein [Mycobacterium sp.]